jgi:methionyl aminopeptidase
MIQLKSAREIESMASGGRILAATHELLARNITPGMTTRDLDAMAEDFITSHSGATPAFKGLYGFPRAICISVNEEIVHGIPSVRRVLKEGDIVSIDIGVGYDGMFTDAAATLMVGEVHGEKRRLVEVTRQSLAAGIAAAQPGAHLGDIGHAVQTVVEEAGFSVVRELVGHGVGNSLHEDPQVPNYGKPKRGVRLSPGLTIAIEPMVNMGGPQTRTLSDKWTIVTLDGLPSAHFEHTVAITESGPLILTALN